MGKSFLIYELPGPYDESWPAVIPIGIVSADSIEMAAQILGGELKKKRDLSIIWFPAERFSEIWGGEEFRGSSFDESPKAKLDLDYEGIKWYFGETVIRLKNILPDKNKKGTKFGLGILELPTLPPSH